MRKRLGLTFMIPTIIVVVLGISTFGLFITRILESEVRDRANTEARDQLESVLGTLQTVDDLGSQAVRSAMKVLLREGQQLGSPEIKGSATIGAATLPALQLGRDSQVANYALVDRIKQMTGGTATLFVKSGDSFIRVSTNVLKPDGSRAIGTPLDPKDKRFSPFRRDSRFTASSTFWERLT